MDLQMREIKYMPFDYYDALQRFRYDLVSVSYKV